MKNILVTGGAGFVGSHVVDLFHAEGYDVTVLDNLTDQVHNGAPSYLNPDVQYEFGDIRDRSLLVDLLKNTDVVVHLASKVGVAQSMYEIEDYVDVNTLATARMLDVIVNDSVDIEKLVVASSMSIYGEGEYFCEQCEEYRWPSVRSAKEVGDGTWGHFCDDCGGKLAPKPTPESKRPDGTGIYAITKKTQEEMCLSIGRTYNIPTISLRFFNIYGPRQSLDNPYTGVCAIFSSRIKNGNPPLVFEDGRQTRDFIHVRDVARANLLAVESDAEDLAVNVGTGVPTTIMDVAHRLITLYDADVEPEVTGDFRSGDIRHCYAETARAEAALGFEAKVSVDEGLRSLVNWGREQSAEDNFENARQELQEKGLVDLDS